MALLRMLYRAAFVCNLCFLIAVCILRRKYPVNQELSSIILIMGLFVAVVLNVVVNVWQMVLRFSDKKLSGVPRWLIFVNGGFLAIQLILLLK
jgi:hypothetical protein